MGAQFEQPCFWVFLLWNCETHAFWNFISLVIQSVFLTPSLPQPVRFPGWKMLGRACKQYVFQSCNVYFSMLCIWMSILSHASAKKKKTKKATGFQVLRFYWSFWNDLMAVKGLNQYFCSVPYVSILLPQSEYCRGAWCLSSLHGVHRMWRRSLCQRHWYLQPVEFTRGQRCASACLRRWWQRWKHEHACMFASQHHWWKEKLS